MMAKTSGPTPDYSDDLGAFSVWEVSELQEIPPPLVA